MNSIFKSTFLTGLLMAISVVFTDFLNAFVLHPEQGLNWLAILIAAGIAAVGYIGKFLSGTTNTVVAMVGSALIAIVPMLSGGVINWQLVGAVFLLKFLGLLSHGSAERKAANPPPTA